MFIVISIECEYIEMLNIELLLQSTLRQIIDRAWKQKKEGNEEMKDQE